MTPQTLAPQTLMRQNLTPGILTPEILTPEAWFSHLIVFLAQYTITSNLLRTMSFKYFLTRESL